MTAGQDVSGSALFELDRKLYTFPDLSPSNGRLMSKPENPENPRPRLAADCMLGKLARWLRILGFDTLYSNSWAEEELLEAARGEERTILTRDTRFFRRISGSDRVIFIENDSFWYQIQEVISGLNYIPSAEMFFTRCSLCNHPLLELTREEAASRVPEYVFRTQKHFAFCSKCGRTYWSGTHQKVAKEMLNEILFAPGVKFKSCS